jgi:Plasmid pRiA4b ORF-3-like protein
MEMAADGSQTGGMKRSKATESFAEIATARIELNGTDPPIWREVEIPTSITLKVLHDIIQVSSDIRNWPGLLPHPRMLPSAPVLEPSP